jgi:two-component system, chemotaxis family, response regulator Rcp1
MADNVNTATMDVLLVEDSPGDVNLARESFRAVDVPISLHLAGSGEEAMAYLRREGLHRNAPRPDIILLDLTLPGMSGREVLVQIKSDESLRAIPTIILSSSEAVEDIQYCYQHNASSYVRKPAQWDSFASVLLQMNKFWLFASQQPPSEPV